MSNQTRDPAPEGAISRRLRQFADCNTLDVGRPLQSVGAWFEDKTRSPPDADQPDKSDVASAAGKESNPVVEIASGGSDNAPISVDLSIEAGDM